MSIRKRFLILSGCFLLVASVLGLTNFAHAPKASAAYTEACPPTEAEGANNTWVQVLQFRIDSLINNDVFVYVGIATDGDFGPQTEAAVKSFQATPGMGLTQDGKVGPMTWTSLGMAY